MLRKLWLLAVPALLLSSCNYSSGLRAPVGHGAVGLEIFHNASDLRDLEADLYQAISLSMMQLVGTPMRAPDKANLVVRGRILEYRRRAGVRNQLNRLQETGVRITIEGYLFDKRTGKQVGKLAQATIETAYIVGEGTADTSTLDTTRRNRNLELRNERQAKARTLRLVAEELVFELFAPEE